MLLDESEQTSGMFYYQRPGRIVWDFQQPNLRTVLIEPGLIWTYNPKIKELQKLKLQATSSEFQVIGFGGTKKSMTDTYNVTLLDEDATASHLKLIPKSPADSMFASIELWVDSKSGLPQRIKFFEKSNDEMTIVFADAQVNPALPPTRFKITPPPGTTITE